MVRQRSAKPPFSGSNPDAASNFCGSNSVVECNLAKVEVAGSNPVSRSTTKTSRLVAGFFLPVYPVDVNSEQWSVNSEQVIFACLPG